MKYLLNPLWIMVLFSTVGYAAPAANTYDVEVVVFANRMPELEGNELWPSETKAPPASEAETPIETAEKPAADSALAAAAAALERSGRHRILAHVHWLQTAEAKSVSKPVKITPVDPALQGSLRLYLSRYLIVELDLALREATPAPAFFGVTGASAPVVYRLTEPRRIKLAETNYFDHPKFGVLVRVTPVKTN